MKIRNPIKPVSVKPKSYWLHIAVIAALWCLTMTLDYHDQMVAAQEVAERSSTQLAACLNGQATWKAGDGTEVACFKAVTQ